MRKRFFAALLSFVMIFSLLPTSVLAAQPKDPREIKVQYYYGGKWYPENNKWYPGETISTNWGSFTVSRYPTTYYKGAPSDAQIQYCEIRDSKSNKNFTTYYPGQTTKNFNASVYMRMYLSGGSQTASGVPISFKILYIDDSLGNRGYESELWENTRLTCQYSSHKNCNGGSGTHSIKNSDIKAVWDEVKSSGSLKSGFELTGYWSKAEGYDPQKWSVNLSGNSIIRTGTTYTDIYLIAKKPADLSYKFILKYDANGGTGAPSNDTWSTTDKHTGSHTFTIKDTVPIREGYVFKGWQAKDGSSTIYHSDSTKGVTNCSVSKYGNDVTLSGNTWTRTLYAVWEENTPPSPTSLVKTTSRNSVKTSLSP